MNKSVTNFVMTLTLSVLAVGCAAKKEVEPLAKWRTDAGANQVRIELAAALVDNSNIPEALELIKRLREEGVSGPEVDLLQGRALAMQRLWRPAEDLLISAKKGLPRDPRPLNALGVLYADQSQLEKAAESFEAAHHLNPTDPSILNNLGYIHLTRGDCPEATINLQKALELDGTEPQYRNNLAFSYICENNEQEALSLLRSTTSEDEARYNLGVGYEIQQKNEVAKQHYERALVINPNHFLAKDALQRLDTSNGESELIEEEL